MTDCDPAALVQAQLEAYNRQDVPAFVQTYAPDAQIFQTRGAPWITGTDAIGREYAAFFKEAPQLRAEVKDRIVVGPVVVDHEIVRFTPTAEPLEAIAVYTVKNCKIARVDFYPAQEPAK